MSQIVDTANFSGLFELVTAELRRRIMTGELPAGTPLRQRQLADLLGVSREPIKHAVRALSHEGLVVKPPRRTAIVVPIRAKSVYDVYEVRTQLDALVARTAAGLPHPHRQALCRKLEDLIERACLEGDTNELIELDQRFHLFIYETAGNELALATYNSAWTIIGRAMSLLVFTNHREKSWVEHDNLVKAIAAGDLPLVGRLSEEHCQNASKWLRQKARHLMVNEALRRQLMVNNAVRHQYQVILPDKEETGMNMKVELDPLEAVDIGRRRLLAGAAGLGLAAALGSFIGLRPAMAQGEEPIGSVTFLSAENLMGKWNPYNHTLLSQIRLQAAAYDLLVHTDLDGKFIPGLATEWSNPEPSIWEFKLREGVRFHDGTPFTATDVKATMEYASNPAQIGSFFFPNPFKADVVDDHTVRIDTGAPYAGMLALMSSGGPVISPAHIIEEGRLDEKFVGTGPYQWVSYEGEEAGVKLTAYSDYWGEKAHIKDYIFRFVGDSQTRLAALQSGQAQIIDRVEPDQVAVIEGNPALSLQRVNTVESKWMAFRVANEPMNNQKLRQAIAHAIDVPSIVQYIMLGSGEANSCFITSAHDFSGPSDTFPKYDPEKAKQLLAEAGYPGGQGLRELTYYVSVGFYPKTREYAQLIVQNLADVGIKVNLQTLEVARYNQLLFDPKAGDLFDHGWFISTRDPEVMLSSLFRTALVTKVKSEKNVEVLKQESSMLDPEERKKYFREEVLPTLETELYEFPMFASQLVTAQVKELRNFIVPPTAYAYINEAELG